MPGLGRNHETYCHFWRSAFAQGLGVTLKTKNDIILPALLLLSCTVQAFLGF